jgi:hypothetical protein
MVFHLLTVVSSLDADAAALVGPLAGAVAGRDGGGKSGT